MASLQAYQSHGHRYYRIVKSVRRNGKPAIEVLAHLGRADDVLRLVEAERNGLEVASVSAGAVTALLELATELDVTGHIDRALEHDDRQQKRDGLTVGETILAGILGRACAPRSKRAFAGWAEQTHLPELMHFAAAKLTSEHFWEQMHAVPVESLGAIEHEIVRTAIRIEQLQIKALAYDTTNFFTHIASTNLRPQLPQRGHNKQGRHDLRQLGLALVVDQATELPLAHVLYEGARSDMKTFAAFLKPVRQKLQELAGDAGGSEQLTLVFDAGASSKENLESLDPGQDHYVTAVRPSDQQALLAEAAPQLADIALTNGTMVRAWRTCHLIAGKQRETVVVFSQQLYDGQLRGLQQHLAHCNQELEKMGLEPRITAEAARRRLARICGRQYVRSLLHYEVTSNQEGATRVRVWFDLEQYQRLKSAYFGLRVLISDRQEWSTAQIIEAYRGQSRVESAFRDLKDPGMLATRPQFHWTDQKLRVHAFMCVIGCLLVRLLLWRARYRVHFVGSARALLAQLAQIRCCRLIERTGRPGRPRIRQQLEAMPESLRQLAESLHALPRPG